MPESIVALPANPNRSPASQELREDVVVSELPVGRLRIGAGLHITRIEGGAGAVQSAVNLFGGAVIVARDAFCTSFQDSSRETPQGPVIQLSVVAKSRTESAFGIDGQTQ